MVLDLMLPGEYGLSLRRRMRDEYTIPIIMLTAVAEDADRIGILQWESGRPHDRLNADLCALGI